MCFSIFQRQNVRNHTSDRSDDLADSFDVNHVSIFNRQLKYQDYPDNQNSHIEGHMNGILFIGSQFDRKGVCTLCFYVF
jgi:hypothetical protein